MNELIKTHHAVIGGETVNAVIGRDLHKQLKSKQQFADWIKNRIDTYGFQEETDFFINLGKSNGRPLKEYIISLDMAKELCMVENNPQGRKIRQYFIQIEKQFRSGALTAESIVAAMRPILEEKARMEMRLEFARNFLPAGNPGELNPQGEPKNQFRRGYYCAAKGRSIMALVERMEQPGLFDEIELQNLGSIKIGQ